MVLCFLQVRILTTLPSVKLCTTEFPLSPTARVRLRLPGLRDSRPGAGFLRVPRCALGSLTGSMVVVMGLPARTCRDRASREGDQNKVLALSPFPLAARAV